MTFIDDLPSREWKNYLLILPDMPEKISLTMVCLLSYVLLPYPAAYLCIDCEKMLKFTITNWNRFTYNVANIEMKRIIMVYGISIRKGEIETVWTYLILPEDLIE